LNSKQDLTLNAESFVKGRLELSLALILGLILRYEQVPK